MTVLSVDYYGRSLVEVELSVAGTGNYLVAWAPGTMTDDAFGSRATEGGLPPQPAHDGRLIYELLPLPVPRSIATPVTVGVAAVGGAGTRSAFRTMPVTLSPPAGPPE